MTSRKAIISTRLGKPRGAYSHAVKVGDLIFLAGQVAVDPDTGKPVKGGVKAQTRRVLENIKEVLKESGSSLDKVVSTTVYVADIKYWDDMNEEYAKYFRRSPPARATVEAKLASPGFLVEIQATAAT